MEAADKGLQGDASLDATIWMPEKATLLMAPRGICSRNLSVSLLTHTLPLQLRAFKLKASRAPPFSR